jgi:hypothetical protein
MIDHLTITSAIQQSLTSLAMCSRRRQTNSSDMLYNPDNHSRFIPLSDEELDIYKKETQEKKEEHQNLSVYFHFGTNLHIYIVMVSTLKSTDIIKWETKNTLI